MIKTVSRQVATVDVAHLREALATAGVRIAIQIDGEVATLIALAEDAQEFTDTIVNELSR
jgi:hypothetical protein